MGKSTPQAPVLRQGLLQGSVRLAAPAALRWLEHRRPARPLHIFQAACNLINSEGEVLSLIRDPVEMNPLALQLDQLETLDFTHVIDVTSPVRIAMDSIFVGGLEIHLEPSTEWPPRPQWEAIRSQHAKPLLEEMESLVMDTSSEDSLASLLHPEGFSPAFHSVAWLKHSLPHVEQILHGLNALDSASMKQGAAKLAGLGPGLTPGGDDFLVGVMHALWCCLDPAKAGPLCHELVITMEEKTNALSVNYLRCAAEGEASQSWHTLVDTLAGEDKSRLQQAVESLTSLGHTSGQDALSGFLLSLRALHLQ